MRRELTALRRSSCGCLLALLVGMPGAAPAETDLGTWRLSGEARLGGRVVTGDDWHSAKYEEYRDQRPGLFGGGRFLLEEKEGPGYLRGWLHDAGERDEHYRLEAGTWGRHRLVLDYLELPHVFSNQARTFYVGGAGDLDFTPVAFATPLDYRLRQGRVDAELRPRAELELLAGYEIQDRQGRRPFSIGFGNPGDNFINFARRVDERIHEVHGGARWTGEGWNLEAGYRGSFFQNDLERIRVENDPGASTFPGADADPGNDVAEGQISLAPDNAAHGFDLSGATALPVGFPARLAASFHYGKRLQDEDFLCHTINPSFPSSASGSCPLVSASPTAGSLELPADSLEGEVDTFLANLVLTARPLRPLNVTARWRLYDYDNDTPRLRFPDHVESDTFLVTDARISVPNEYRRQNASLDASWRFDHGVTVRGRYAWEQWSRGDDREVQRQDEHGGRLAIDWRPSPRIQLGASYELGIRRGNGYDPRSYLGESYEGLSEANIRTLVFDALRKSDLADRDRERVALRASLAPRDDLALSLQAAWVRADFSGSDYGLREDEQWSLGAELAWQASARVGLSLAYTFEELDYDQRSRWRPRNFGPPPVITIDDPLNDWSSRSTDQVHGLFLRADLDLVPERLEARLGYGLQHARARTRASAVPGFVGIPPFTFDSGAAESYPTLEDVLQSLDVILAWHPREDWTFELGWRLERFDLRNFKIDDLGLTGTDAIFLGERIDDYTANILTLGVVYEF